MNRSLPVPVVPRVPESARERQERNNYSPAFPSHYVCTMDQSNLDDDMPGANESYTLTSLLTAGFYLPEFPLELQYFSYRKVNK